MALSTLAKFNNSLKFEGRSSGAGVSLGPVYGPAGFLAIRYNGDSMLSADGSTWTNYVNNITSILNNEGAYGLTDLSLKVLNNQYFVYGMATNLSDGTHFNFVATSSDGISWSQSTPNLPYSSSSPYVDFAYFKGLYVAVSKATTGAATIYTSTNLTTWTSRDSYFPLSPALFTDWRGVANNASTIKAVGGVKQSYVSGGQTLYNYYPTISTSTNGTTWTKQINTAGLSFSSTDRTLNAIAVDTSGNWVAVGRNGAIFTQANGSSSWTFVSGQTADLYSVTYQNGTWVIFGNNIILTSTNRNIWTASAFPTNGKGYYNITDADPLPIAYGNGKWIVEQYSSTTGTTWDGFDYKVPNQQPYLDYTLQRDWATWKTIDFWVYIEKTSTEYSQFGIVSQTNYSNLGWNISLIAQPNSNPQVQIVSNDGTTFISKQSPTFSVAAWHHIRFVSKNNTGALYIDGTRVSLSGSNTISTPSSWPAYYNLQVGRIGNSDETLYGRQSAYWIDELLIDSEPANDPSVTSFIVPTTPWVNTPSAMLLLHFDVDYEDDNSTATVYAVQATSYFDINANVSAIRKVGSTITTTTSLSGSGRVISKDSINVGASSSLTINASKIARTNSAIDFSLQQSTIVQKFTSYQSNINTTVSTTVASSIIRDGISSTPIQTSVSASGVKKVNVVSNQHAFTSVLTAIGYIGYDSATIRVQSSLSARAIKIAQAKSIINVITAETAEITKLRVFRSNLNSAFTLSANNVRSRYANANLTTDSQLYCEPTGISAKIPLSSSFTVTTTVNKILIGSSHISNTTSVTSKLNGTFHGTIRIGVNSRLGIIIPVTDLSIFWMVPAEDRNWNIYSETRDYLIEREDRTYYIKG